MTYGELFKLFSGRNKDLSKHIDDYRPAPGAYNIQIWLKNGTTFYARWIEELQEFVFSEAEN